MAFTYEGNSQDAFDSDKEYPMRYRTSALGGSDPQIICPAAPTFPPARSLTTPTKYYMEFPGTIDVSDLDGNYPIVLKDGATTLTKVSGTPGVNEYRIAPSTSEHRTSIWMNSGQAGNAIDYDLWIIGGAIRAEDFNNINITGNLVTDGTVLAGSGYVVGYRTDTPTETTTKIKTKILEVGDWDMDADTTFDVDHGLSDHTKIRSINLTIRSDSGSFSFMQGFNEENNVNVGGLDGTKVQLERTPAGVYDSTNFDTPIDGNRGWIYIIYEA